MGRERGREIESSLEWSGTMKKRVEEKRGEERDLEGSGETIVSS